MKVIEAAESMRRMLSHYISLIEEGKISKNRRLPKVMPNGHTDILVEQLFYAYMEQLQEDFENNQR